MHKIYSLSYVLIFLQQIVAIVLVHYRLKEAMQCWGRQAYRCELLSLLIVSTGEWLIVIYCVNVMGGLYRI
jgi:hypothetical protein